VTTWGLLRGWEDNLIKRGVYEVGADVVDWIQLTEGREPHEYNHEMSVSSTRRQYVQLHF